MLFPTTKEKEIPPPAEPSSPAGSPELKARSKRSSMEKKKEKASKQRRDDANDGADADDEDSLSGGAKPVKSRSIGEVLRGVKQRGLEKSSKGSDGKSVSDM